MEFTKHTFIIKHDKLIIIPRILHNVFTIRSAFAGFINGLSNAFPIEALPSFIPKVRLVTSATVPIPKPTAN